MWYQRTNCLFLLWPFSLLYRGIVCIRRWLYRFNIVKKTRVAAPVIIVGNITVGGTGKTPCVIALSALLKQKGYRPGIITRGYRGKNKTWPCLVTAESDPVWVGDEAVLLAQKTGLPVMAGKNRVASATALIQQYQCNIIISDDGLQHYALVRDIEIAVIDGMRRFGNGFCLPAGPLREPISRLKTVDFVVTNGQAQVGECQMNFVIDDIVSLLDDNTKIDSVFCRDKKVMAIAGIGNPERFFQSLKEKNIIGETKIFPDHYAYQKEDIAALSGDLIVMTEKDAVKCRVFADPRCYVARGHAVFSSEFEASIDVALATTAIH